MKYRGQKHSVGQWSHWVCSVRSHSSLWSVMTMISWVLPINWYAWTDTLLSLLFMTSGLFYDYVDPTVAAFGKPYQDFWSILLFWTQRHDYEPGRLFLWCIIQIWCLFSFQSLKFNQMLRSCVIQVASLSSATAPSLSTWAVQRLQLSHSAEVWWAVTSIHVTVLSSLQTYASEVFTTPTWVWHSPLF